MVLKTIYILIKQKKILTIQLSMILYFRYQTNIKDLYYLIYIIIKIICIIMSNFI